jgi:hypothetical protein
MGILGSSVGVPVGVSVGVVVAVAVGVGEEAAAVAVRRPYAASATAVATVSGDGFALGRQPARASATSRPIKDDDSRYLITSYSISPYAISILPCSPNREFQVESV